MASSILVFRQVMRSHVLRLGLAVVLSFGLCSIYSTQWGPELRFWKQAYLKKMKWADQLQADGGSKVVFAGGSSCTFAVRPDVFQQMGISCVNMGGHAGMGALFLCSVAIETLNAGDTLILAVEPDLLSGIEIVPRKLGIQTATVLGDKDLAVAEKITGQSLALSKWLSAMRPGGRHTVTMLSKILLRRPLYRYSVSELGLGGWAYTSYQDEVAKPCGKITKDPVLSSAGMELLLMIKQRCDEYGVHVAYAIPVVLTEEEALDHNRSYFKQLGEAISHVLPVLNDPFYGAESRKELFADTALHLTPEGASMRSKLLAQLVQEWDVISAE
tara:strand:+ start:313 stop:1299 length:987 start_codon:yes stop_codon:yes gene_type:complete